MKGYGLLLALLSISPAYASQDRGVVVTHFEALRSLQLENAQGAQQKIGQASPLTLEFDALGQRFRLELEPNDRLLSQASRESLPDDIALYRGRLSDKADSWARIVVADGVPQGLIWDGTQMYAIEASGDSAVHSPSAVMYRLADTYVEPGTMSCGASGSSGNAAVTYSKLIQELTAAKAAQGAASEIQLSAIGDFEFTDRIGANASAGIVTRLNNVDGIFSEQLGVQITVGTVDVHADSSDPFTNTSDAGRLLDELGRYRRDTPRHRSHGLTHLYTGRNLRTSTVGIAYLSSLCSSRFGAGLTEGRHGSMFDSLISTHEIGHNFGAPHDAEEGSACVAEESHFIMAPSLNGSTTFSQCSIDQMQTRVAGAACVTALPSVDMTISLDGAAPEVQLGSGFALTFDATNIGTATATAVEVDILLPDLATFVSVAASSGSCTSGAGNVSCQLGTLPAGSNRTVTLQMTAADTGTGEFAATVSADADDDPDNNDESVEITVTPAVDLAVNALAPAQVDVNATASVGVQLENRSNLEATGVQVSVAVGAGLEARTAVWSLGSCTISVQQVDCVTESFASQSAATLDLTLAGVTAGASSYVVTVSSAEAETDSSNNSANGSVTVNAASADVDNDGGGGSGGGGGGAAAPLFLWILSSAALFGRCRGRRGSARSVRRY